MLFNRIASGSKAAAAGASGSEKKKSGGSSNVLDDEPDLASNSGVVAALKMARKKGYLMENQKKEQGLGLKHLQAKNYSIDDKVRVLLTQRPKVGSSGFLLPEFHTLASV